MSSTFSADNGASALELQLKHNWKNPAMALEYIANSSTHREKTASYIQGIDVNETKSPIIPSSTVTSEVASTSNVSDPVIIPDPGIVF